LEVSQEVIEAHLPAITAEEKRAVITLCLRCNRGPLQEIELDGLDLVVLRCWNCHAVWSNRHEPSSYAALQYEMFLEFLELTSGQERYSVRVPNVSREPEAPVGVVTEEEGGGRSDDPPPRRTVTTSLQAAFGPAGTTSVR
jgi:hypothetical protein